MRAAARRAALALVLLGAAGVLPARGQQALPGPALDRRDTGCLSCHDGLEEMHPWLPLSCTECHGGDGSAERKEAAHVAPAIGWPPDERVLHTGFDPPAVRFRNPSDLRVAAQTCGQCHGRLVEHLRLSLHGTTAGHLNDGLYENGVNPTRQAVYGVFGVRDDRPDLPEGALSKLLPIEALRARTRERDLGDHFADLPRKACMQCHLWSEGVAVTGRLGQDGLYRGAGCAACHVPYAEDGRSQSGDRSADRFTPGRPLRHALTAAPATETCTRCHIGDASIGNGFRGMAQLYPQMPAGPHVPDTTDRLLANQFFIQDPVLTPPDIHHAAGMHCIDCHTLRDVMGDGYVWGAMEQAVEIECTSCHGTIDARADGTTARGRNLDNLERKGDLVVLRSKVTGRVHRVKQAQDVVDPEHPDYNERAAAAMTRAHDRLECYACHAGWNTNFFGFHFDRNEQFTQLDLVTGNRTPGSVSTQERVFATLRQYVLGLNPEGLIAPYMVGFSTMGTVHGPDGGLLVDQGLPETAAGLSGMTLIHHQPHTTQPAARSCLECHRSPATFGLGTGGDAGGSFALARGLLVTVGERGLSTLLLDRHAPEESIHLARLPLGGARAVALDADVVSGRARTAFVAIEHAGVAVVDVANPAFPRQVAFVAAGDARDVALAGGLLLVANGAGGLRLVDVSDPRAPRLLSDLPTQEARGVQLHWPRAYVADGPGGLLVADVSVPSAPRVVGQLSLSERQQPDDVHALDVFFQYGRPDGHRQRTPARMLAVLAAGAGGVAIADVTHPEAMEVLSAVGGARYADGARAVDVVHGARYELGDTTGVTPTVERDVAWVLDARAAGGAVTVLDVTEPRVPAVLDRVPVRDGAPARLAVARSFVPPLLVSRLLVAGEAGLDGFDATDSDALAAVLDLDVLGPLADVAVEAFAFDRMVDEEGRQLKDISHEGARFLFPEEIHRVLTVPGEVLGGLDGAGEARAHVARVHGGRAVPGGDPGASQPPAAAGLDPSGELAARRERGFRLGPAEPLARMVRHVDPRAFDANRDGALGKGELTRLLFDGVLDADGDGRLSPLEWPRHPGADPGRLDRDGDGSVSRLEMTLDREVFSFFDVDGDGRVSLDREWPWEVLDEPLPSLLYATLDGLRALLSGFGVRRQQSRLYRELSGGSPERGVAPHDVPDERLQRFLDGARGTPLSDVAGARVLGGFLQRWDLDGDGAVTPGEHRLFERIAERCDLDRNGRIDARDASPATTRTRR